MPLWVGISLCEGLVGRENQIRQMNLRVIVPVMLLPVALYLLQGRLTIELFTLLNAVTFTIALAIQHCLLSRRGIKLRKCSILSLALFAASIVIYLRYDIMKILFVENRFRTRIWETFADCLINDGHQVLFLVQNHLFHPRCGRVWVIPYPNKTQLEEPTEADRSLILSDRNINYFGHRSTGHYTYYRKLIRDFLEKERPDVTFGESTAFHELQTIDLCRELSIPYLQPSTCRFPPGRFSFYRYDTLEPFSGSGETMSDEQAIKLINSIVHRTIKPDYMQKYRATLSTRLKRWNDLIHLSVAYLGGEHYNTPAPWVKLRIERQRRKLIRKWNALAESRNVGSFKNSFRLLYPMQMQPEANLDVWGRPYRNQLEMLHHCTTAYLVVR